MSSIQRVTAASAPGARIGSRWTVAPTLDAVRTTRGSYLRQGHADPGALNGKYNAVKDLSSAPEDQLGPVARLQQYLGIKVDGYFGADTRSALRTFQIRENRQDRSFMIDEKAGPQVFGIVIPQIEEIVLDEIVVTAITTRSRVEPNPIPQLVVPRIELPRAEAGRDGKVSLQFPAIKEDDMRTHAQAVLAEKKLLTDEPSHNLARTSFPSNFNVGNFVKTWDLLNPEGSASPYHPLTGAAGEELTKIDAEYFVVHESDGLFNPNNVSKKKEKLVNLWIGRNDRGDKRKGHHLANDMSVSKSGTYFRRPKSVSVELNTPKSEPVEGKDFYTDQQYRDLAIAYVMASYRAGEFLTVLPHREIDRGGYKDSNGHSHADHSCTRAFKWDKFYGSVRTLLGVKDEDYTFGYQAARDKTNYGDRNWASHVNVFKTTPKGQTPNIYGEVRFKKPV